MIEYLCRKDIEKNSFESITEMLGKTVSNPEQEPVIKQVIPDIVARGSNAASAICNAMLYEIGR